VNVPARNIENRLHRNKFDLEKLEVDLRDWPLMYFYEMCDMLYSSEQKLYEVISEWNDGLFQRMQYSALAMQYFVECKNTTLAITEFSA